jgi:hypothetical protein
VRTSSPVNRIVFGIAALITGAAFVLHFSSWLHGGTVNWPDTISMAGLFVITVTGALATPPGRIRMICTAVALALIIPSFLWNLLR